MANGVRIIFILCCFTGQHEGNFLDVSLSVMVSIKLKKILKRDASAIITSIARNYDTPIWIEDPDGKLLWGNKQDDEQIKHRITLKDELLGWVCGVQKAASIADLISHLARREDEIKALSRETLEKYKEINLLYSISAKMAKCLEPRDIAELVLSEAEKFITSTSASLMLFNEKTGFLEIIAAHGQNLPEKCEFKYGEGIAGNVFSSGHGDIFSDVQASPWFVKSQNKIFSLICIPLTVEDRTIGVINISSEKQISYSAEDYKLAAALASQATVSIENALMIKEVIEKERVKTKILDAFGKYVTREVRDQILGGHIPLDGEVKDVTVLFADLRDFTALAESNSPKEVVKIINGYFSEMADAISKNNGLVLQFIGDEIEAVFGAPLPLENHPTHAVRAAIAMRERLDLVNKNLQQQGYVPLRHGIGIHTGNVVAANIGSEDRLSYALVGDTVNVASRIQGLNKKFDTDILISATTVERLADNIEVTKLPATAVKGKRVLVEIFKLI